jgi:hypothetical protein
VDQWRTEEVSMAETVDSHNVELALHDKTGALLMLDKRERKLLKELLTIALKSPASREWITKKLGSEYLEVAEKLLKSMGGA